MHKIGDYQKRYGAASKPSPSTLAVLTHLVGSEKHSVFILRIAALRDMERVSLMGAKSKIEAMFEDGGKGPLKF